MDKPVIHLTGDQLSDYAEGMLDIFQRKVADSHLENCEDCRRELQIVQGYFTDFSALEHPPAPANFLAKVRERIEKPSTGQIIQRWFTGFWRVVPVQFALLTLLGITIIVAYLQQNGGLGSRAIPETSAAAQPLSEPAMPKKPMPEEGDALSRRDKAGSEPTLAKDAPAPVAKGLGKANLDAGDGAEKKKTEIVAESFADVKGYASGSAGVGTGTSTENGLAVSKSAQARQPSAAPATTSAPPAAQAAPLAAAPPRPEFAAKRSASADLYARAESAPMRKAKEEKAAPVPFIVIHLSAGKDSTQVLNGLKSMGAQVVGEHPGNHGLYELDIPASMWGDLPAYFERYGEVEMPKPIPATTDAAKIRISLRMVRP